MTAQQPDSTRGILKPAAGFQNFELDRFEPADALRPFVENYWSVKWDLRDHAPYKQTILSFPSVNLSFEIIGDERFAGVYGIPSATYTRSLQDEGMVLGVKFKPGGFFPFWKRSVAELNDKILPLEGHVETSSQDIAFILEQHTVASMAEAAERFLLARLPERDEQAELAGLIVDWISEERSVISVENIAEHFSLHVRTLQRLFSRYIGVSPKWVIKRFRLQEAAERMKLGEHDDWTALAQELGYFDQAHFIKDFKAMVGKPPDAYARELS
ncbi:helix-turn-helix domain-containing protein [Paenibacillus sp. HB172176]|uniref:helix-turn-helix domain-containing protein n=1 Tax=Paenibacillus sp. HB172176 TaxID=2493690 RepID=UPI00143B6387|nr:helix-turn-helix domain-containing protein [Paenibacillus sp. HB172176]